MQKISKWKTPNNRETGSVIPVQLDNMDRYWYNPDNASSPKAAWSASAVKYSPRSPLLAAARRPRRRTMETSPTSKPRQASVPKERP